METQKESNFTLPTKVTHAVEPEVSVIALTRG
jgi:hypothetical protein